MRNTMRRARLVAVFAGVLLTLQMSSAEALPYDGTNPQAGCNTTAITAKTKNILNAGGGVMGHVDLRYSTACRTTWSHVYSSFACQSNLNFCQSATVHRNSDGQEYTTISSLGAFGVFSLQVNDANVTSYALGCIYYTPTWYCAQTASY